MEKKKMRPLSIVSAVVLMLLAFAVIMALSSADRRLEEYSYSCIAEDANSLADKMNLSFTKDNSVIAAMSELISETKSDEEILNVMKAFQGDLTFANYFQYLRPDGTVLKSDGETAKAGDKLVFSEEVKKGSYLSDETKGIFEPTESVVFNAAPAVKDGEVKGVLYGVVKLESLMNSFSINMYDGHAYLAIVDDNGNFVIDTWHKAIGDLNYFSDRELLGGKKAEDVIADILGGGEGNFSMDIKSIGGTMLLHYRPVGIKNWSAIIAVTQKAAYEKTHDLRRPLYVLAISSAIIIVAYALWLVLFTLKSIREKNLILKKAEIIGTIDEITGLLNRNAFEAWVGENPDRVFEHIGVIYADANGLHEINNDLGHHEGDKMLRTIAKSLSNHFPEQKVYRLGGDEFAVISEILNLEKMEYHIHEAVSDIENAGYTVSVGLAYRSSASGVEDVMREADEKMLEAKRIYYTIHDRRAR